MYFQRGNIINKKNEVCIMKRLMKGGTGIFSALLFCLALVFSAGSAGATSMAEGTAWLDYSVTLTGEEGITYNRSDSGGESYAAARSSWDGEEGSWDFWTEFEEASVDGASASLGSVDDYDLSSQSWAGVPVGPNDAAAWSQKSTWTTYEILEDAVNLEITVDYHVDVSVKTNALLDWTNALAWVWLTVEYYDDDVGGDFEIEYDWLAEASAADGDDAADSSDSSVDGQFIFSLDFDLNDEVTLYGYAYTDVEAERVQPIPEPTTMLLLGIGLIGFAVFRKKFRKA